MKLRTVREQIWRSRDLVSHGSIVCRSREQAERFTNPPDYGPFDESPRHPHVLEVTWQVTYPDGSVLVEPWRLVEES